MSMRQRKQSIVSRAKLYLILGFISLTLFFYSVSQIAYVVCEPSDLLGLVFHFPLPYWIGLALLIIGSISAFLDKELESDAVYLCLLFILGLYIFGIATLVEENARHATVYHNIADVRNVLLTGHSDMTGTPWPVEYYRTWPAVHLISASTIQVAGISLKSLVDYAPWFWLISYILITYAVGKRFGLSPNLCFALSFLAITSYWMYQSDCSQQAIGSLLYLLCFMLIVSQNPQHTVAGTILAILCLSTLIISHGLTALALVISLITLSIYRKVRGQSTPFLLLLPTLWLTWYIYQAHQAFRYGITKWWAAPWDYILRMGMHVEGIYEPPQAIPSITIAHYSQLAYIFIYGSLIAIAIIYLLIGRVKESNRQWVIPILVFLIGAGLCGLIFPTSELWQRFLILGLVGVTCIMLKTFSAHKLIVALMILCLIFILPARYATEAHNPFAQVYSTELAGSQFFGYHRALGKPWLKPWLVYRPGDSGVISFYDADIHVWPKKSSPPLTSPELLDTLNGASYVLNSEHGGASDKAVNRWMGTDDGVKAALIYDNGAFRIYMSHGGVKDIPPVE